jgi:glycosyltransferase involved in cell wall biosynthesis
MYKVLVVAYYYPPLGLSGVQRTLKFTKYFKDFNWSPTVITTGKIGYFAYDETLLKEATEAGIEIVRTEAFNPNAILKKRGIVKMPSTWLLKLLSRISKTFFIPDNKLFWSKKAAKVAKNLIEHNKYDAIFISVPPFSAIKPFVKLKEKFDIPLFVDYRDAWLSNQFRFYPTPYHRYRHKKQEDYVLRKVDRIIAVNRHIKENLIKSYKFLKFDDIDIIRHGYDSEDFENSVQIPKENDKLIITYAGIFYEEITPKYLLRAFKQLSIKNPDIAANIRLRFVGHFKKENQKLVNKLQLERFVEQVGYLDHSEVIKEISSSDVLWLMLPNNSRMNNVTPGKLYEYFGTRKPIIANLPNGIAKTVAEEYGASYITLSDDINEIVKALEDVHRDYVSNKLPKPDEEYVLGHDRKKQTEHLIKIFQFYLKAE